MAYSATGRRKRSIAQVSLKEGRGRITINNRNFEDFFPTIPLQNRVLHPFQVVGMMNKWDVEANIRGGGVTGQLDALRLGISRALLKTKAAEEEAEPATTVNEAGEEVPVPTLRGKLKEAGLLTRDARSKERKKPGQPKARKRFQFSKR